MEKNFVNMDNNLGARTFFGHSQKHEKTEVWNNKVFMT